MNDYFISFLFFTKSRQLIPQVRHLLVPDENSKIIEVQVEAAIEIAETSDHNSSKVEAITTTETIVIVDQMETTRSSATRQIGTRKVVAQAVNGVATTGETTTEIIKVIRKKIP